MSLAAKENVLLGRRGVKGSVGAAVGEWKQE
jgi:hypothetical protein